MDDPFVQGPPEGHSALSGMLDSTSELDLMPPLPNCMWHPQKAIRVDVSFPELPSDADTELPSWRSGLHSDWKLRLGPTVYSIHKVLTGHGPRASAFLCSAFTTGQQLATGNLQATSAATGEDAQLPNQGVAACAETDLSQILPEQVWPFFNQVLDYIYSEELTLTDDNSVALLRCADALQIRSLFLRCVAGINDLLNARSAPRILADCAATLAGPWAERIQKAAQDVIVDYFDSYTPDELMQVPTANLAQILRRDDLSVVHENEVFDCVEEAAKRLIEEQHPEEAVQLWQSVRFGALSNSYFVQAAQIEAIPKMALIWAKVLHRKYGSQMLQSPSVEQQMADGWPVGPPRPRKPFKDLVCAVMYSVDTDARNDQDVERNITAATLVAEEIEFLGGRAILENIFARPPSARESSADNSIINMDQVDVAFVLAPWTPSEKRISRLINFVDQGGGAVLLSFIGGLMSKGVWREMEYEPLITGKVAADTPYEDVYLSGPAIACLDLGSLKRNQDTMTPPRVLCGVDSINGRRRITSKLMEGAKVLAKWSDGQPLVVQHPTKNLFSVSQRVSRIFELDEHLGHDDTLQLVLNVMLQAGKNAKRLRRQRSQSAPQETGSGSGPPGTEVPDPNLPVNVSL